MQISELFITGDTPAIEAMRKLDETGRRIVFVAPDGMLQATLTDSDTRKFILKGGDLSAPAIQVANKNPKSLPVARRAEAFDFMLKNFIDAVPLLNEDGRIVDVAFVNDYEGGKTAQPLDMPVVVMAGGLGTRLYPYTKVLPKPLIPIGEVPILELVMQKFRDCGCSDYHLVVNYRKNMIKSYFADLGDAYSINWVDEDEPLGTGGGLYLLKGKIEKSFFLTNCDTITNADYADIAEFHQKNGNAITMVCAMKQYTIPYGVVELDEGGGYAGISEKPCMNFLTNTGMYVVQPNVLNHIEDGVKQGFPDIIEKCRAAGGKVGVYPIGEASWMDMGQMEELDEMRRKFEQG